MARLLENDQKFKVINSNEIIMVDDNDDDIALTKTIFERSGLNNPIKSFVSGEEFLHYMNLIQMEKTEMPALVLLDINMPKMNGFEVLAELRNYQAFTKIPPVIFFSNSSYEEDKIKASQLGAGFKTKPMEISDYINFFNSLIN